LNKYSKKLYSLHMGYAETIAANVRAEARRREIKNQDLAERLGISVVSLSKRMNSKIEFKPSELEIIANYMNVDLAVLTKYMGYSDSNRSD